MKKAVSASQKRAIADYRRRQKRRGLMRVEVQASKADAALLRGVASALADPARQKKIRALLRERFGKTDKPDFKAFLTAAPLEGVDLSRGRDMGRDIEF